MIETYALLYCQVDEPSMGAARSIDGAGMVWLERLGQRSHAWLTVGFSKLARSPRFSLQWLTLNTSTLALLLLLCAPPGFAFTAQRGDRGATVRELQTALELAGHSTGGVDGIFGNNTEYAVKQFQAQQGLSPSGVIDNATAIALGLHPTPQGGGHPPVVTAPGADNLFVIVTTRSAPLNVRQTPSTHAPILTHLRKGAIVPITGKVSNGWSEISGGGWVYNAYTRPYPVGNWNPTPTPQPMPTAYVKVITNGVPLNVRQGPSVNYPVINQLAMGLMTPTTGKTSGDWIEVTGGGWVNKYWVEPVN